jgi:hypothetical protein
MKIPVFRDVTPEGNNVSEEPTPSIPMTEAADFSKILAPANKTTRYHNLIAAYIMTWSLATWLDRG